ncbi:MAG: sugar phosphate nucleotidyltransferase [Cyanophyceae cyanobacterium]
MRAVLMAGGSGTRLRPLTCDLPKPMVPILNRPIAEHIINLLKRHQIHEVIATLHYLPDTMQDYFHDGSGFGVHLNYAVEERQPLGTAGCVKNIEEVLDDTFIVISGDCVTDFDLSAAIAFHRDTQSSATLVLKRVPNPLEFGVVILDDDQKIVRFLEKPSTSEIFSDTVNTGIYILEPTVLGFLPKHQSCDFSKDLFPLLLDKNVPMYGYVAEGYWCDVGHLDAYRNAQYDALHGKVAVDFPYEERSPGIWIGQNTQVDASAQLHAPLIIGNNCRVGPGAILEAGTIIGDNVTVGENADLKRPILWNGVTVGAEAHLRACTVGRGSRIDRRSHIMEGAVVGSLSVVGEEAQISPTVRIWPSKQVESGAILNMNLIWGQVAQRALFDQRGVAGLANIDITPEFAVKLGTAYGSTLEPGNHVSVSRDQRSVSRMVARAFISGLMSVGVDVYNLEAAAIPVARNAVPSLGVKGGVHMRVHPNRPESILVEFFDADGINISKAQEKKIEGAYFKEDLRRVQVGEIGNVVYPAQTLDNYCSAFETHLKTNMLLKSRSKVVIDYAYAVSGAILPELLAKFGCDAVVLNASLRQTVIAAEEKERLLVQLGQVVDAVRASFGVQVSANGEQFVLVDENGGLVRGANLTALMVDTVLFHAPRSKVVVPVSASSVVERLARRYDAQVVRTKASPTALMEACHRLPGVVLGGSGDMGFIFPELHPGFDAMFCIAKLIEMLTVQERSLVYIHTELIPRVYHKSFSVHCPWTAKGALMRDLVETHPPEQLELIDGVKIYDLDRDGWVLLLPDASTPLIHIVVDGSDRRWVEDKLRQYRTYVQNFVERDQGLESV